MINLDMSFYSIVVHDKFIEGWSVERKLADMSLPQTVLDIASGQIEDVVAIIEWNAVEGWSRDVTEAIAEAVAHIINSDFDKWGKRPRPDIHTWVEKHCSVRIPAAADRTFQAA